MRESEGSFAERIGLDAIREMLDLRPSELKQIALLRLRQPFRLSGGDIQYDYGIRVNGESPLPAGTNLCVYVTNHDDGLRTSEGAELYAPDTSSIFQFYPMTPRNSMLHDKDFVKALIEAVTAPA